jgi:hypothetical protein
MPDYPDYTIPVAVIGTVVVTGTVNITGPVEVYGDVNATVTGTVSIAGTVNVEGTVSIAGTVNVTGTVSVSGPVNIQTAAVDNIIIDKLTVGAVKERRTILENNGTTASFMNQNASYWRGKFFPRGARGYIREIQVYCRNLAADVDALTVAIGHRPNMGFLLIRINVIEVPANSPPAWRSYTVNRLHNYDSLFVAVKAVTDVRAEIGYDTETDLDNWDSTDGVTWTPADRRIWIRVVYAALTVGDVPIAGTINTVTIPNTIGDLHEGSWSNLDGGAYLNIIDINRRMGQISCLVLKIEQSAGTVTPNKVRLKWIIDGDEYEDTLDYYVKPFIGAAMNSTGIAVLQYDPVNNAYTVAFNKPLPFQRQMRLYVYNDAAAGNKINIHRFHVVEILT